MIYLANVNLNGNELQNAVLQPLSVAPSNPKLGQIYCNSTSSKIMWYDGSAWKTVGVIVAASQTNGKITVDGTDMTVYTLPKASATALGGIKVGSGLVIDANGVLSAASGGMADSVEWTGVQNTPTTLSGYGITDGVQKETGKGLSTNDYTAAEKNKLSGIASGAEVNVNADWTATSGDAKILNKPTALSAFTNDSGFITKTVSDLASYYTKSSTYTKTEVDTLIGQIATIQISVVTSLPATGSSNIIYLVAKSSGSGTQNVYDEYIWVASASKYEHVGDTAVDLTNYLTKTGNASKATVAFTAASSRTAPVTGEAFDVIVGKIVKYFTDLKAVAFSGSYSDLTNQPVLVKKLTGTISTSATSASISCTGNVVSVNVIDSVTHETVLCDVTIGTSAVTVSVSAAPSNALSVLIYYI